MPKINDYYNEQPVDFVREATRKSIMNQALSRAKECYKKDDKDFALDVYNFLKGLEE